MLPESPEAFAGPSALSRIVWSRSSATVRCSNVEKMSPYLLPTAFRREPTRHSNRDRIFGTNSFPRRDAVSRNLQGRGGRVPLACSFNYLELSDVCIPAMRTVGGMALNQWKLPMVLPYIGPTFQYPGCRQRCPKHPAQIRPADSGGLLLSSSLTWFGTRHAVHLRFAVSSERSKMSSLAR